MNNTQEAYPINRWHEDDGTVLWWRYPVEEPPYVGTPLDTEWEENEYDQWYTHWSRLELPTVWTFAPSSPTYDGLAQLLYGNGKSIAEACGKMPYKRIA